jgi:hypothetical protein
LNIVSFLKVNYLEVTMKAKLSAILIATILVGCASGPSYEEMSSSITNLSDTEGRVYIYRSKGSVYASPLLRLPVNINGEQVGNSIAGGFIYANLAPGSHEISVGIRKLQLEVMAGTEQYVEIKKVSGIPMVGQDAPTLVSTEQGKEDLKGLAFTGG